MTDFTKPKELTSFEKPGKEKKDPEKSCNPSGVDRYNMPKVSIVM